MATKKSSSSSKGRGKVGKVMHEYKEGQLKSGGRKKVKSRKQAVAIALSEARRSGAHIPKKASSKKAGSQSTAKKAASKKSTAKKSGAKKSTAKKSGAKKTASKKRSR